MHAYCRYRKFIVVFFLGLSSGFFLSFWVFRSNNAESFYAPVRRGGLDSSKFWPDSFLRNADFDMTVQETQTWSDFKDNSHHGNIGI
jgi:hypothetical protein